MRLRLAAVAALLLAGAASCRDPLCVVTVTAICPCHDPLMPQLTTCEATVEKVTCSDEKVDPCVEQPCCLQPPDGGHDGGRDAPPADATPNDAPPADATPNDAPPVDAPPVDAPPVDAPPVDASPVDATLAG